MVKSMQHFPNVRGHGNVDPSLFIVPVKLNSATQLSFPVGCNITLGSEGLDEMLSVLSSNMFDAEIINGKAKSGRFGLVLPQAGRSCARSIAIRLKMLCELLVG